MAAGEGRAPLSRLLDYARPYRGRIRTASVYSVLNKLFDLAPPFLIGLAVDVVANKQDSFLAGLGIADLHLQLWVLAGLTVVIWGAESLFEYLFAIGWRSLAQDLQHGVRMDVYGHVQGLEMAFFEDRTSGSLMSVLNDDVNQLERFLDRGANDILQTTTTVLAIGGTFMWMAPSVAWMAVLPIPLILWGGFRFQKLLEPRYAEVRERASDLNGDLGGNLGGMSTIKAFTAEQQEVERIASKSLAYREANAQAIRLSSAFIPLIRMVIVVGFCAMLVFAGKLALDGRLGIGSFSVMVFLIQRLLWPLTRLGETLDLYQRAMASTKRLLDLLDREPEIVGGTRALERSAVRGDLAFENLVFTYPRGGQVFDGLSLKVPAGRTTAIVGTTGSGKTTLVKLLLRFHDPQGGRILLDGLDTTELDLQSLRQAVGYVGQDVFLHHASVHENIAYSRPDASRADVERAAAIAEADGFIAELPGGYETIVGERGLRLSGGQRQRISIARAVLADPPILVLDEATSSVDNETEAAIQRSLAKLAVGRTTLVIAHRLSTIRHADRIVVLEHGAIAESGRHDALIQDDGIYAGLWNVQTGAAVAMEANAG